MEGIVLYVYICDKYHIIFFKQNILRAAVDDVYHYKQSNFTVGSCKVTKPNHHVLHKLNFWVLTAYWLNPSPLLTDDPRLHCESWKALHSANQRQPGRQCRTNHSTVLVVCKIWNNISKNLPFVYLLPPPLPTHYFKYQIPISCVDRLGFGPKLLQQ